jgi:hypothetical protein
MTKNRSGWKAGLFGLVLALCPGLVQAAPPAADIPETLKPWKAWVLYGEEAWSCPEVAGVRDESFCAWPGELKLDVRQGGMQFSQTWELQQDRAIPLPGQREYWPQRLTVDGKAHPVLNSDGVPVVWLSSGKHTISGWIPWMERPQTVNVPEAVALISLTVDGRPVLPLDRHEGELTLGESEEETEPPEQEGDSSDFQIYRKLTDGIPATLTTRVNFKVSGKARELSVPNSLPPNFVPTHIGSRWAARLDKDGRLLVQAKPGHRPSRSLRDWTKCSKTSRPYRARNIRRKSGVTKPTPVCA